MVGQEGRFLSPHPLIRLWKDRYGPRSHASCYYGDRHRGLKLIEKTSLVSQSDFSRSQFLFMMFLTFSLFG